MFFSPLNCSLTRGSKSRSNDVSIIHIPTTLIRRSTKDRGHTHGGLESAFHWTSKPNYSTWVGRSTRDEQQTKYWRRTGLVRNTAEVDISSQTTSDLNTRDCFARMFRSFHFICKVELTQTGLSVTCCDNHVLSMWIKLQNIHFGSISALKGIQDM